MKGPNIVFGFGIGLYYSVGVSTSLLWSMTYYSIITGYILSLIFKDKMSDIDKYFGAGVACTIWLVFLGKAIFYTDYSYIFDWTRFYIGIVMTGCSMFYLLYCIKVKLRYNV